MLLFPKEVGFEKDVTSYLYTSLQKENIFRIKCGIVLPIFYYTPWLFYMFTHTNLTLPIQGNRTKFHYINYH